MKSPHSSILLLLLTAGSGSALVIVNDNFDTLTAGALVGQDSWAQASAGASPAVALSPTTANYTGSLAATSSATTGTSMGYRIGFTAGTLTPSSKIRIEFDTYRPGGTPLAFVGIGDSSATYVPPYFGISGNQFQFRGNNFGTTAVASGANFEFTSWYRVASELDLATGTATFYAKNLTAPNATAWETNTGAPDANGFRQLYFGAGLTLPTASLGTIPSSGLGAIVNWDSVFIRTSPTGATSYLDNITVTVLSDYSIWATSYGVGAATADDDNDGLTNQQEYAFGLLPNSGTSANPISVPFDQATRQFTYTRRLPSLTGLVYTYQYSTSLGSWTAFTPDVTSSNSLTPVEAITVTVPAALTGEAKLFVRVAAGQ